MKQNDQSNGLLLLALEGLEGLEKLERYFKIFWINFMNQKSNEMETGSKGRKNCVLISIRAMSDFIMKYDILNPDVKLNL